MQITSSQNKRIKEVVKLSKRRQRDERRVTVVEGIREVSRALRSGIVPEEVYICPELATDIEAQPTIELLRSLHQQKMTALFEITPDIFAKMAYRADSGGLLLVIPYRQTELTDLSSYGGPAPFFVVIENVEKPGNLGAILRTADAAGVDGLILCTSEGQTGTDIHNPNVVRASLGALFSVSIAEVTTLEAISWLGEQNIPIVATTPSATLCYTDIEMTRPITVVMGSEAYGLSQDWLQVAKQQVMIPMHGVVDSLNLSTSTALLLYEVVRQGENAD